MTKPSAIEGAAFSAHELLRSDLFLLEIAGVAGVGFSRCSGLETSRRLSSYAEGGRERPVLLDDGTEPGTLRLERGLTRDPSLFDWFERGDTRDGAIVALDESGKEQARWRFLGAIPTRWKIADLDAETAGVALEMLELSYEGIEWE